MPTAEFGIGITSWNEPGYLAKCLETLAANDLRGADVHVFQDGNICHLAGEQRGNPSLVADSHKVFDNCAIERRHWHEQSRNVGYYNNRLAMLQTLADCYDAFLVLESDVIVGRNCVRVIRNLIKQFGGNERVGTISPSMKLWCRPEQVNDNWDAVLLNDGRTSRLCIEAMTAATWRAIEPNYLEYGNIIGSVPYYQIGQSEIREAVRRWAISKGSDITEVSGDTAILRAIILAGKQRMFCVVNRSTNIGDHGMNCTPEILMALGDGHQTIYESEREVNVTTYRIVEGQIE